MSTAQPLRTPCHGAPINVEASGGVVSTLWCSEAGCYAVWSPDGEPAVDRHGAAVRA